MLASCAVKVIFASSLRGKQFLHLLCVENICPADAIFLENKDFKKVSLEKMCPSSTCFAFGKISSLWKNVCPAEIFLPNGKCLPRWTNFYSIENFLTFGIPF